MKKILVIEDDVLILENLLELLEAEDFQGIGARNGKIGLELAQQQQPDLILCDVMMPELDGHEVLCALRGNPVTASIPFIFLTAKGQMTDLRKGMDLGADDYLIKPCTADQLVKAIHVRLTKSIAVRQAFINENTVLAAALSKVSEQLQQLLYYDRVTQLPNRLSLRDRFQDCLRKWQVEKPIDEKMIPLLYLDLDRFSRINETLGEELGDQLLKAVAVRLKEALANEELVAHINTDEFVIIGAPITQKKEAINLGKTIQEKLSQPFNVAQQEVFITASIGIALYPDDGNELEKLLKNGKKAMEKSKESGRNTTTLYTAAWQMKTPNLLSLETDLSYALEREELTLYYQPQVSLKTGEIVGCEALARWYHPVRGLISPVKFIPIAEETGLIDLIGQWVLKTACQQMKIWNQSFQSSLRVTVNLSTRQLNQIQFREQIMEILVTTGLNPKDLELEITESSLVQDSDLAARRLKALKNLGLQLAIDDFGTGYSSFSYLRQFPFDTLKIDQIFIRDLPNQIKNVAITDAMISMAHQMNLKVIAEGVETQEELHFLKEHHCDEIQGFLFSKPLPKEEFEKLVARGKKIEFSR
jgi:diguanylate cyclase